MADVKFECKNNSEHDKFSSRGGLRTYLGFIPKYDKEGRPLNADPNYRAEKYICMGCGKKYTVITQGWITRHFERDRSYLDFGDRSHFKEVDSTPDYIVKQK